nr:hypothetical protein [Sedimentibacter sp.]
MAIERILGTDTGKAAFYKVDRNFEKLENAININYDNSTSGITAENIQEAIDEITDNIGTIQTIPLAEGYFQSRDILPTSTRGNLKTKIYGNTAVNLVKNGNFADGTTGWAASGATGTVSNNEYIATITATGTYTRLLTSTALNRTIGDKIFFCYDIYPKYIANAGIRIESRDIGVKSVTANIWNTVSAISTMTLASDAPWFYHVTASNYIVGDTYKYRNIFAINMTALGIEDYTEEQMLAIVRNGYFDGLQGASNIEILSVGKNLFDGKLGGSTSNISINKLDENSFSIRGLSTSGIDADKIISFNKFKGNTQYTFSGLHSQNGSQNTRLGIVYTDGTNQGFSNPPTEPTPFNITSQSGKTIAFVSYRYSSSGGTTTYKNFQIEEDKGQTLGIYEPYKSTSNLYKTLDGKPVILHRLPNGIRDEIDDNGRKIERNLEYELKASDIIILSSQANTDYVYIKKPVDSYAYNNFSIAIGAYILENYTDLGTAAIDDISNIWKTTPRVSGASFVLVVPQNIYPTLADAQTALAGTKIVYQKATPEILDTNATPLIAEPNGTVFISSQDSPLPATYMEYTNNVGAVLDGLIDGQKQNSELLKHKANIEQEDWITATLQNGWTGTLQYRKNSIGQLEVKGELIAGSISIPTIISSLVEPYRPTMAKAIAMYNANGSTKSALSIHTTGNIYLRTATDLATGNTVFFNDVLN